MQTLQDHVEQRLKIAELQKLNGELWESVRRRDVKIATLEDALLSVTGVRKDESSVS